MVEEGEHLKVHLDNIEILKNGDLFRLPLSDIGVIVLDGLNTTITTRLLSAISKYNVALVTCDTKHHPCGMYMPFCQHSRSVKTIRKQASWRCFDKGLLWQKIVKFKIENQKEVLRHFSLDEERVEALEKYIEETQIWDKSNREGHSAKVYFNTLFDSSFSRDRECIENAMLNYGYSILRAYISRAIVSFGLIPSLGIFHKSEYNSFSLADDFLEVFRPIVDLHTYSYISKLNSDSNYLNREIRISLVEILSKKIFYKNKYVRVSTAVDCFVRDCVNFLNKGYSKDGRAEDIPNIKLRTFEGIKSEV